MITCSVCGAQNDDLAMVCASCKGYLQTKVDILDLFSTVWGVIESPHKTFHRIALARTKNYTFFLSATLGWACVFGAMWYLNAGRRLDGLAEIIAVGGISGPFVGLALVVVLALVSAVASRLLRGVSSVRNSMAAIAYASAPIIVSFALIFPIEIALFGKYFFDVNPSPRVLNPLAYFMLTGFDAAAMLWSIVLAGIALAKANQLSVLRGYIVTGLLLALLAGLTAGVRVWWG